MKHLVLALLASAPLLATSPAAQAMAMLRQGDTLVLTGPVVPDDARQFHQKLGEGPLKRVILLGSHGGDSNAGYAIAAEMQVHDVDSVVAGSCVSACAVIFMGGHERQMMGGKTLVETRLGFHAPHKHATKALSPRGADKLQDWLQRRSGGKFTGELLDRVVNIAHPGDVLFFYYPGTPDENGPPSVVFCDEGMRDRSLCEAFPGATAVASGVLTTSVLFAPDTPVFATEK